MAKTRPTSIKIRSIDLTAFNDRSQGAVGIEKLAFRVQLQVTIVPITNLITVITNLEIGDFKFEKNLGNIETRGEYVVNEGQVDNGLDDIEYQKRVMSTIVGTQLSTTRGMLLILGKGTALISSVLPIMPSAVMRTFIERSVATGNAAVRTKPKSSGASDKVSSTSHKA